MKNKTKLANIALAAFVIASAAPANALIDNNLEAKGTFLAKGCGHGGKKCGSIADNGKSSDMYDTETNSYQMGDQPYGMNAKAATLLTEVQLLALLNPQSKAIYLSFDPDGKALAIELASQDTYQDKNLAVKEAQRRINERKEQMNR